MKISEFKTHPLFPFMDFRENDASFLLLELFWTVVAKDALGEELTSKCVPLQDCERDIERFYNPVMLDFWIPEMRRGARVTLMENPDNRPYMADAVGDERFTAYLPFSFHNNVRSVSSPDDEIDQILIHADMSPEAIDCVSNGIKLFLVDKISKDDVLNLWMQYMEENNFPSFKEEEEYYDRLYPDD